MRPGCRPISEGGSARAARFLPLLLSLALLAFVPGCGDEPPTRTPDEEPPIEAPDPEGLTPEKIRGLVAGFQLGPLPAIPYPTNNPYNPDRIRLGRLLFFDPILGGESAPWIKSAAGKDPYGYRASDVACATCHMPQFGYGDGRPLASGVGGGRVDAHTVGPERVAPARSLVTGQRVGAVPRNSMPLLNTAFNGRNSIEPTPKSFQFMDGRVSDGLEFQAFLPFSDRNEMAGDAYGRDVPGSRITNLAVMDSLRKRVAAIPGYVKLFREAFPGQVNGPQDIRADMIPLAIAAFERELVTPGSRYDRFVSGEHDVFTPEEKRGFALFFTKGRCGSCHYGPMLSDFTFRCQGVGDAYNRVIPGFEGKNGHGTDWGRWHAFESIPEFEFGKFHFRVLTIRNVELTAPYFHSGSARTLREVVEFHNRGGLGPEDISNDVLEEVGSVRDPAIVPLGLTDPEIDAIVAFMKTTTAPLKPGPWGQDFSRAPDRVPSGLLPPGVPTPGGAGPLLPAGR